MLSLKEFKRAELSFPKQHIVGGWAGVIHTSTGDIVHRIDDCDGTESWTLNSAGTTTVSDSPEGFARGGDVG